MTHTKTIALTICTFVGKVMSLLINMLSRFVIPFFTGSKFLLISWLKSPSTVILEHKKVKSVIVSPFLCHEVMGPDVMILVFWMLSFILVFWMLSFKPTFSLSYFTFIKRIFSSLSAIRVLSSAYLRLLIFLLAILIQLVLPPAQHFSWCTLYMLNKQGDNIQPWHTPFPIWNQSVVPCPVLPVASWPVYRFLKRQVRWSGIPISFRIFQFIVIHTVKGFGIVKYYRSLFFTPLTVSGRYTWLAGWLSSKQLIRWQPCHL